jgi:type I restriction enzyme S subunit
MKWQEFKLSQLAEKFISGGTPNTKVEEYWSGNIPWITGADFSNGEIIVGRRFINHDALNNSSTNIVPEGSIALVTRTGVGKIAVAQQDVAISQDITGIVLKNGIDADYVIAAIRNKMEVLLSAQRGATIKGITRNDIADLVLPLPPLSEQRRIVEILNQAKWLRQLRAEADKKAERIIPALFVRMFGDPATNPKGWKLKTLEQAGATVRYGLGQPPSKLNNGTPLIRATNINRGLITSKDLLYVNPESIPKSRNAFLSIGEVLVVRSGAYTGDVAQVTKEWEGSVAGYDLIITPGDELNSEFIAAYLLSGFIQNGYFKSHKTRAGQPHLNANQLLNTPIFVAEKTKQEGYARHVKCLRKYRIQDESSKNKIDLLFKVLLYRAFSGDLTASWRKAHMKELLQEMELQAKVLAT